MSCSKITETHVPKGSWVGLQVARLGIEARAVSCRKLTETHVPKGGWQVARLGIGLG